MSKFSAQKKSNNSNQKQLLNVSDAAKFIGISASTLRRLEAENKIGSVRDANGYRLFNLNDIVNLKTSLEFQKQNLKALRSVKGANRHLEDNSAILKQHIDTAPLNAKTEIKPELNDKNVEGEIKNIKTVRPLSYLVTQLQRFPNYAKVGFISYLLISVYLFSFTTKSVMNQFFPGNLKQISGVATNMYDNLSPGKVLALTDQTSNFLLNINVPTFIKNSLNVSNNLEVSELSRLLGGIETQNADANFGTGTVTTGQISFIGIGALNNLLAINEVTETTLEEALD